MKKKINIKGVIISSDVKWIYDWFDMESTSPKDVNQQIEDANGVDLEVIINSPGGEVFAGSEIYTSLKDYKGNVTVKIVGVAASAASVVAMAGDKVLMSPTAQIMIHNASTIVRGDYRDMDHTSEFLQNVNASIANAYMLKSGLEQEELLELMNQETWFTAQQALDKKLVDEVMFEGEVPTLVANANANEMQMIPQQIINKIRNEINTGTTKNEGKGDYETMDLEKLKNEHPELYAQVKQKGFDEGVNAENERIKEIEALGIVGNDDLVNSAKYETKDTAEKLAVNILKAQKELGNKFIDNRNSDAKDLNNVQGSSAPQENNESDIKNKGNAIAEMVNKMRMRGAK